MTPKPPRRGLPTAQDRGRPRRQILEGRLGILIGVAYAIPIIYVSMLIITHVVAFCFLLRPLVSREWTEL